MENERSHVSVTKQKNTTKTNISFSGRTCLPGQVLDSSFCPDYGYLFYKKHSGVAKAPFDVSSMALGILFHGSSQIIYPNSKDFVVEKKKALTEKT